MDSTQLEIRNLITSQVEGKGSAVVIWGLWAQVLIPISRQTVILVM